MTTTPLDLARLVGWLALLGIVSVLGWLVADLIRRQIIA